MADDMVDVLQVGYGPVGQVCAALLGRAGRSVTVIERYPSLYGLPRAGHVDHEIMRTFQSLGITDRVLEDAVRASRYIFRNKHGEELISFDWDVDGVSGWGSDYYMFQPYVEDALNDAVEALPGVTVHHGWTAIGIEQQDDFATVRLRSTEGGEERALRARFVIGADGGNSFVRRCLGIDEVDLGFRERWLVIDYRLTQPVSFEFDNGQICDPARPMNMFELGRRHRRFAFMVLSGEDSDEMRTAEAAWRLISDFGIHPENAQLVRHTVYVFESKYAAQWRRGRVFLVGDSAHVMPPFLGQGLCSGLRDAANLAWKLDLVMRGLAPDRLLDSYQEERSAHTVALMRMSIEAGRLSVTTDPELAAARDAAYRAGTISPPQPFPWLTTGLLHRRPDGVPVAPAGRLSPQGVVSREGRTGRFDDLVAPGWTLLLADASLTTGIPAGQAQFMADLGIRVVVLGRDVDPCDDAYRDYFEEYAIRALLYRPDFYVFGGAGDAADLSGLIDELARQVTDGSDHEAA